MTLLERCLGKVSKLLSKEDFALLRKEAKAYEKGGMISIEAAKAAANDAKEDTVELYDAMLAATRSSAPNTVPALEAYWENGALEIGELPSNLHPLAEALSSASITQEKEIGARLGGGSSVWAKPIAAWIKANSTNAVQPARQPAAPKQKRAPRTIDTTARASAFRVINSGDYPAIYALSDVNIKRPAKQIPLILARKKNGAKLTNREIATLESNQQYSDMLLKGEVAAMGPNGKAAAEILSIIMSDSKGDSPSDAAGYLGQGTSTNEMWQQLRSELKAVALGRSMDHDQRNDNREWTDAEIAAEEAKAATPKQTAEFDEANDFDFGRDEVSTAEMKEGDTVTIDGEEMVVESVEEDGSVILRDGARFGRQTLESGETVWVETAEAPLQSNEDLEPVATWLVDEAEEQGYGSADEFAATDREEFDRLAQERIETAQRDAAEEGSGEVPEDRGQAQTTGTLADLDFHEMQKAAPAAFASIFTDEGFPGGFTVQNVMGLLFAGDSAARLRANSITRELEENGVIIEVTGKDGTYAMASKWKLGGQAQGSEVGGWQTRNLNLGEEYAKAKRELAATEKPWKDALEEAENTLPPGFQTIPYEDGMVALQDSDGNDIRYPLTQSEAVTEAWSQTDREDRYTKAEALDKSQGLVAARQKVKDAGESWNANGEHPQADQIRQEMADRAAAEQRQREAVAKGKRTRAAKKEEKKAEKTAKLNDPEGIANTPEARKRKADISRQLVNIQAKITSYTPNSDPLVAKERDLLDELSNMGKVDDITDGQQDLIDFSPARDAKKPAQEQQAPKDTSHLNALEIGLSRARGYLRTAKTPNETRSRELSISQYEKEIAAERGGLGMPNFEESDMTDEQLLAELSEPASTKKTAPASKMDIRNADSKELFADDGGFKLGQDSTVDGDKVVAARKAKDDAKAAMDAAQGDIFAQQDAAVPAESSDPNIGREWSSKWGRQRIKGLLVTGGTTDQTDPTYEVETIGKDEIRRYQAKNIEEVIQKDKYRISPEYAEELEQEEETQRLREERDARQAAAKQKELDAISEFTKDMPKLYAGKVREALLKAFSFNGKATTRKAMVEELVADGKTPSIGEEPRIKEMTRTQFNRATQREQDAHAKKVKEGGNKKVYFVGNYDTGKIGHDYAQFLVARDAAPATTPSEIKALPVEQSKEEADKPGILEAKHHVNRLYKDLSIPQIEKDIKDLKKRGGHLSEQSMDSVNRSGHRSTSKAVAEFGAQNFLAKAMDLEAYVEARKSLEPIYDIATLFKFFGKLREGEVTADEVKAAWETYKGIEAEIRKEVAKMTMKELEKFQGMRKPDNKAEGVRMAMDALHGEFRPGVMFSYGGGIGNRDKMNEAKASAQEKAVAQWTDEMIQVNAQERRGKADARKKALENPETLDEWQQFVRRKGLTGLSPEEIKAFNAVRSPYALEPKIMARGEGRLTPEQLSAYDEVRGIDRKAAVQAKKEQESTVRGVNADTDSEIVETKHTKTGADLFVVKLADRVEKDVYTSLSTAAKKMGGYYSSYRVGGAVPGFQFKDRATAEQFQAITKGETVDRAEAVQERQAESKNAAAERLTAMADKMEAAADSSLNADRKTNTAKRAREAGTAEASARTLKALATTMRNLASAVESGEATHLDGVRTKTHVDTLEALARRAKSEAERTEDISYGERQKREGEPTTPEQIDKAKYPFPFLNETAWQWLIDNGNNTPGAKRLTARLEKVFAAKPSAKENGSYLTGADMIEVVKELLGKINRRDYTRSNIEDAFKSYDRVQAMGLTDLPMLRAALREFLQYRGTKAKADPIKAMERELIGMKIPGFFPTPSAVIERMIEEAGDLEGKRVLEPSAGKGDLVDAARDAGATVDAIEQQSRLRGILEAKGASIIGQDFMDVEPSPVYDAVLMNPPFEDGQDAEHVTRAFQFLKPGGKLVAITGEGIFSRSDKKAQAFRDWLESVDGTSEKLPEGSFKSAFRPTGVNTRMVVITKPSDSLRAGPLPRSTPISRPQGTLIQDITSDFSKTPAAFTFKPSNENDPIAQRIAQEQGIQIVSSEDLRDPQRRFEERTGARPVFFTGGNPETKGFVEASAPSLIFVSVGEANDESLAWTLIHELIHVAQRDRNINAKAAYEDIIDKHIDDKTFFSLQKVLLDAGYHPQEIGDEVQAYVFTDVISEKSELGLNQLPQYAEMRDAVFAYVNGLSGLNPRVIKPTLFSRSLRAGPLPASASTDAAYLAAVEAGDIETAQRMVDEAAKVAGYNVGPVWHGTPDGRFLKEQAVFKSEKDRYGWGKETGVHWFADSKATASTYADERRAFDFQNAESMIIPAYLKLENPLKIDGKGEAWRAAQTRGRTTNAITEAIDAGNDGVVIRNVQDDYQTGAKGKTRPTSTYAVFSSNAIKSADPVTRDSSGEIIPLSQRFNPASDSILYAGPIGGASPEPSPVFRYKVPVNKAMVEEARNHRDALGQNVSSGKLAGFGSDRTRAEMDAYDAVYEFNRQVKENAESMRHAREMLARDPDDVARKLEDSITNKTFLLQTEDHLAIQLLIDRRVAEAGNNPDKMAETGAMMMAYRIMRGDVGRLLQVGYDRFLTPAERNLAAITDAIFAPTKKVQKSVASRPISERTAFIRAAAEARVKKVEAELAKYGSSIAEITRKSDKLALENSQLMKDVFKLRKTLDQNVLKMIQHGAAKSDIKSRYGAEVAEQAQAIKDAAREELKAKIAPMVQAGMTMEQIVAKLGALQAAPLNNTAAPLSLEAIAAEIERILTVGFGLDSKPIPEKPSLPRAPRTKGEKKEKSEMTKAEIEAAETSAMEKVAKRWMEKLAISQSDTLSWGVKAQANINAMEALIREHVKNGVKDFRQKAEKLGATEQQSFVIDKEAVEERRRVALIKAERESRTKSQDAIAEKIIAKYATSQSDTLAWGKPGKPTPALLELFRKHLKTENVNFVAEARQLGVSVQKSEVLNKETNEERRRVEAINTANAIAANTPEAIAKKWIGKFTNSTTYTRRLNPKGKPLDALAALIKSHLKSPATDFIKQATALGVTQEQAKILESETTNERAVLEHVKAIKKGRINPLTDDWTRPKINEALDHYVFDTKDRSGIMTRVENIRLLAGATGMISTSQASQDKYDAELKRINALPAGKEKTKALENLKKPTGLSPEKRAQAIAHIAEIDKILAKYGTDTNTLLAEVHDGKHIEDFRFNINDFQHVSSIARIISTMDADWIDKAQELLYANMLSGIQTMIVNATAILPAAWEATVGRGFEIAINSALTPAGLADPLSPQWGETKYILKALGPAWTRAVSNFVGGFNAQHPVFDRDVLNQQPDIERMMGGKGYRMNGSISGKKGDIIRLPSRLLMATDDFNMTLFTMADVGAYAFRFVKSQGFKPGTKEFDKEMRIQINNPGSESYILAATRYKRAIFSNPLPGEKDPVTGKTVPVHGLGDQVGLWASKLNNALADTDHDSMFIKLVQTLAKISFFPFQRVPFNILRKGIRYTPNPVSLFDIGLGIIQNSRDTGANGETVWKWNAQGRNTELIERMGMQLQGAVMLTLLMATGAGEGDDDDLKKPFLITGSMPFTPQGRAEREAQIRSGLGPSRISFRRKDGTERVGFNYGRFEPLATTLAATIDTIKAVKRAHRSGKDNYDAAAEALGGLVAQAQNKSFLRGVSDLMALISNAMTEPDLRENRKFQQFLASKVAMVMPNIIKQPIREADGLYRERSNDFMQELLYQVAPIGQKSAKVTPWGDQAEKTGFAATRIFDVTDAGTDTIHPVDKMLLTWRDSGKWAKAPDEADRRPWFPAPISNATFTHKVTGQTVKMDEAQLSEFREKAGKTTAAKIKSLNLNYDSPTALDIENVRKAVADSRRMMKDALSHKFSRTEKQK